MCKNDHNLPLLSNTEMYYLCLAFIIFSEATQTSEKGIAIENKQNETKDLKSNPCKVFFLLLF